jgi:hypothetical protein
MEEAQAIIGILLISAVAATGYFVINSGTTGAQVSQSYVACCCNILTVNDANQVFVRSQIQMFAGDCQSACQRYELEAGRGMVFPQQGLCAANP